MIDPKKRLKKIFLINAGAFFIASIIMFFLYNYFRDKKEKLEKNGIKVYATVTQKTFSKSKGKTKYYLHYKFNNYDAIYNDRNQVRKDYWEKTNAGETIFVIFEKNNPNNSRIDSKAVIDDTNIFIILFFVFFVLSIFDIVVSVIFRIIANKKEKIN